MKIREQVFQQYKPKCSDITNLKGEFWFILVISFLDKLTVQPLIQNSALIMQTKYNISLDQTGSIIALPYFVFFCLAVPLGIFFDKYGYRLSILIFGFALLMISQIIFLQHDPCPEDQVCYEGVFPIVLMGITFAIVQLTIFTGIQYVVGEKHLGTAYGLIQAFQNIGATIGPLIFGSIM